MRLYTVAVRYTTTVKSETMDGAIREASYPIPRANKDHPDVDELSLAVIGVRAMPEDPMLRSPAIPTPTATTEEIPAPEPPDLQF